MFFGIAGEDLPAFLFLITVATGGALLYMLPQTIQAIKTVFRFLPVDGSLKQIGLALAEALCEAGFIETPFERMKVNVVELADGTFYLSLAGSTFYESSLFADSVAEILAPIESPRYLVVREGTFINRNRVDYHAVPSIFGVKKETAAVFHDAWRKYVSPTDLLYTRSADGRKKLLKAKMKAFSSAFSNEIKRQDKWQ